MNTCTFSVDLQLKLVNQYLPTLSSATENTFLLTQNIFCLKPHIFVQQ